MKHIFTTTALAFFLFGCAVGPDYTAPDMQVSSAWSAPDQALIDNQRQALAEWWQVFQDPVLTKLIQQAASDNLDIRIATARVREARALRGKTTAQQMPAVNVTGTAMRTVESENAGRPILPDMHRDNDYYEAGFDVSWELDIFGGVKRSVEAADARLLAAEEQKKDVLMSVLAEVARNYADLRGVQARQSIIQETISLQKKTVDLVRQRHKAGDASDFELAHAEARLRTVEATLPNLTADLRAAIYRLSVLMGQEPQALIALLEPVQTLPPLPDIVPVGLRSDILRRRPDIRVAERNLAASTADIGVATADLFPRFFLTGSSHLESLTFGNLYESSSVGYSLGPRIQWPIFQGGAIRARIKAKTAQADAAALQYEKSVLIALEEAENALIRYGQERETQKRLQKAVAACKKSVLLATHRYQAGEDGILSVIDAERELANARDAMAESATRNVIHLIGLYKALGGGWEAFESVPLPGSKEPQK